MRKLADQARRRGHNLVAEMFEERSRAVESDVRAIHDVIVNGAKLEPVGQEGI